MERGVILDAGTLEHYNLRGPRIRKCLAEAAYLRVEAKGGNLSHRV